MRKTYETEKNRESERQIVDLICELWDIKVVKLPRSYSLDYAMLDNKGGKVQEVRGFLEVKKRSPTKSHFSLYMISLAKVMKARELTQVSGLPSLLVVKWSDDSGWINFADDLASVGFGGRDDREDWQDQEPVAFMRISNFKNLKKRG